MVVMLLKTTMKIYRNRVKVLITKILLVVVQRENPS
jgi:hypothetical protein